MEDTQEKTIENSREKTTIVTPGWMIEIVCVISSITHEIPRILNKKAMWYGFEYISLDFINEEPKSIFFDLDNPEIDEDILDSIIHSLVSFNMHFQFKLYGFTYDTYKVSGKRVQDFKEELVLSPTKIWYEEYKDKMDYEEFKKEHPEHFI